MAKFQVAAVFSNHMVLQRDKNVKIFGQGNDGDIVTLTWLDNTYTAEVKGERWTIILAPSQAGTGYEMKISCGETVINFENIAVGDVWLAGGQSNMELELQHCKGGMDSLKNDVNPNVRFYYTQKRAIMDETFYENETNSSWQEFGEENSKAWSAVGYYFGKKIAASENVTVGIIGCNWGGTSASSWMDLSSLEEDNELKQYVEEYQKGAVGDESIEDQIKAYLEFEDYHNDWNIKYDKLIKERPDVEWEEAQDIIGVNRWPGPLNCASPFRPAGLYETMVKRIMPYTLKGFIYYQGESDDQKAHMYQKLLTRLIRQWREDWDDLTLPFLFVQLTMHRYKADPDWKNWCLIREAQMNTYQTVKNTGLAVIIDVGEFNEIHPKDKRTVGERLALQAQYHVYGTIPGEEAHGPIYRSFRTKDGILELSFDYAEAGFKTQGEVTGFEVAGLEGDYVPAEVALKGSKILLKSKEVANPERARYAWTNYGPVTVFGANGLPMSPFRTNQKEPFCP